MKLPTAVRMQSRVNVNTMGLFQNPIRPQSLDTDVQRPFYSVATVVLLPFINMERERQWPRWTKKALHIGIKRLWI